MNRVFEFESARLGEAEYPSGRLELDDAKREVEATYEKKSLFRRERLGISKFLYDASTKLSLGVGEVGIGDLTLRISKEAELEELAKLIRAPKEEALSKAEKSFSSAMEEAGKLLAKRAETLSFLTRLKASPREVLISEASKIPDDAEDPVSSLLQFLNGDLAGAFEKLRESLSVGEGTLGASFVQKSYALVYSIELYQDGIVLGSIDMRNEAIAVMAELGVQAPALVEGHVNASVADVTTAVLSDGARALLAGLKESMGVS